MSQRYSAFTNDVLGSLDATAVSELIHKGDISLDEAIDAAIERTRKAQPVLNAMVVADFERVKTRAKAKRDSILNAPAFLKDNINLTGLPTRFGSGATSPKPSSITDDLVNQLHAAGLNFIGKSSTPAFGFGCSTEYDDGTPPTRNPWNLTLTPGGSSGGSAALVASGVVPIAHANDGGGSIRIPAALCGLIGLKPSRGRLVQQRKAKSMPIDIVSDGVLTRTVRDTANFFYDAERFYKPSKLKPIGLVEGPNKKRLKIGFVFDSLLTKACPETRQAVEKTAKALSDLGHHVEETTFMAEERFANNFTLYWSFLAFTVELFGQKIFAQEFDRRKLDGLTKGLSRNFSKNMLAGIGSIFYLKKAIKSELAREWNYDAVISPVLAKTTPELGYLNPGVPFDELLRRLQDYVGYTPLANAVGNTAISLPMHQSERGEPIGIQISAPVGDERLLLELAFELESACAWKKLG